MPCYEVFNNLNGHPVCSSSKVTSFPNPLYLKDGKLYELAFDMDPQFVAQALINILEVFRQMGPVQALPTPQQKAAHPLVVRSRADHSINNYDYKLAALDI